MNFELLKFKFFFKFELNNILFYEKITFQKELMENKPGAKKTKGRCNPYNLCI